MRFIAAQSRTAAHIYAGLGETRARSPGAAVISVKVALSRRRGADDARGLAPGGAHTVVAGGIGRAQGGAGRPGVGQVGNDDGLVDAGPAALLDDRRDGPGRRGDDGQIDPGADLVEAATLGWPEDSLVFGIDRPELRPCSRQPSGLRMKLPIASVFPEAPTTAMDCGSEAALSGSGCSAWASFIVVAARPIILPAACRRRPSQSKSRAAATLRPSAARDVVGAAGRLESITSARSRPGRRGERGARGKRRRLPVPNRTISLPGRAVSPCRLPQAVDRALVSRLQRFRRDDDVAFVALVIDRHA